MQNPLNGEPHGVGSALLHQLSIVILKLKPNVQQLLVSWLAQLPKEVLGGRVVRPLQRYLSAVAQSGVDSHREEILRVVRVLDIVNTANEQVRTAVLAEIDALMPFMLHMQL